MTQFISYKDEARMAAAWTIYDHANWFKRNLYYDFCGVSNGVYFTFNEADWLYIDELLGDLKQNEQNND